MGIMALATLLIYGNTFNLMQWILETVTKDDTGYFLFNLSSNGIAMIIMFPATFCAGMTLPLITTILLRKHGEKSIGDRRRRISFNESWNPGNHRDNPS